MDVDDARRAAASRSMVARIRATLDAYRVHFDRWFTERTLHEGSPSAIDRALAAARGAGPPLPLRRRALAADHDVRRRQGPRARSARPASRRTSPPTSPTTRRSSSAATTASSTSSAPTTTATSSRMKAAMADARRRPRPPRDPAAAVRPHRRGRLARVDVQAPRRLHHARRAHRRDRRRRDALVHAHRARTTRRSTSTSSWPSSESSENPVYYVQYAHARIHSVLGQGGGGAGRRRARARAARPTSCTSPSASSCASCSRSPTRSPRPPSAAAPHRIAAYALELAQVFTAFYRDCQVVGSEPEAVEDLRLRLCVATQRDDRPRARAARRLRARADVGGPCSYTR